MKIIEIAKAQTIENAPTFMEIGGNFLSFILRVFGFVVIISLVISAILYFTAAGDEDRIKLAKKSFFYSVVGIFVGLGAMLLFSQITNLLK